MNTLTFCVASGANHKTMKSDFLRSNCDSTQREVLGRPSRRLSPVQSKKHRRWAEVFAVQLTEKFTTKWIPRWWFWIPRPLLLTNRDPRSSAMCQGPAASPGSGRGRGLPLGEGLEVDGQGLFLRVRRTSELVLGYQVAQQHPEDHQQDPQDVGQHPLWSELGVGWSTESPSTNKKWFCACCHSPSTTCVCAPFSKKQNKRTSEGSPILHNRGPSTHVPAPVATLCRRLRVNQWTVHMFLLPPAAPDP